MKKLMFASLMFAITACGQNQAHVATWASGDVTAQSDENIDVEVRKVEDAVTLPADVVDAAEATDALMKTAAAKYFVMSPQVVKLAHGTAQFWEGCSSNGLVKGGYGSDTRCGNAYFHPTFSKQMQSRFYLCAERAAAKANVGRPSRIFMRHDGSYNNRNARNSKRLSMHAYARAIDIASFNLYDAPRRRDQDQHQRAQLPRHHQNVLQRVPPVLERRHARVVPPRHDRGQRLDRHSVVGFGRQQAA